MITLYEASIRKHNWAVLRHTHNKQLQLKKITDWPWQKQWSNRNFNWCQLKWQKLVNRPISSLPPTTRQLVPSSISFPPLWAKQMSAVQLPDKQSLDEPSRTSDFPLCKPLWINGRHILLFPIIFLSFLLHFVFLLCFFCFLFASSPYQIYSTFYFFFCHLSFLTCCSNPVSSLHFYFPLIFIPLL